MKTAMPMDLLMVKKIVILIIIFLATGCATFEHQYEQALEKYDNLAPAKAMATAYDNVFQWVAGYGYNAPSSDIAYDMALKKCKEMRSERNIKNDCNIIKSQGRIEENTRTTTTFESFQDSIKYYKSKPLQKAIYLAYDSEKKWAAGIGYRAQSDISAINTAKSKCEDARRKRNISSQCLLFALDNTIYFDELDPKKRIDISSKYKPPPAPISPPPPPAKHSDHKEIESTGTGFAVREDGYILTCYHVVENADTIGVYQPGGKIIPAKLVKYSRNNDLALLKINTKTPYYLTIVESVNINIGDHVFTIGFPAVEVLGVEPKYTEGTISSLSGVQDEASFMQISVPVQPGNSGGPLVNDNGKVVGIITSTAANVPFFKTTGSLPQNINWAVKAEIAEHLFKKSSSKKLHKLDRSSNIKHTQRAVYLIVVSSHK